MSCYYNREDIENLLQKNLNILPKLLKTTKLLPQKTKTMFK